MQYSIVKFKKAIESSYSKRIDPEFFYPKYLTNDDKIKKCNYSFLSNFIQVITGGATPLGAEYNDGVVPFLRVQNIMENYIDTSDIVYISKEDDNLLSRSRLKKYDVLLTITGAYGKSSVVLDEQVDSNINQHSVKMEIKNINPFYLSTFFNTKHGYMQSTKNIVGITRPALDYSSIRNFLIPIFSNAFQKSIEKLVLEAHHQRQISNSLMKEANEILEKEIGFDKLDIKKKKVNYSIVNYSETLSSKRIDAEYYQEKYKIIIDKIQSYKNGCIKITDLNSINNKLVSICKNKKYEYIELSNIDSMGFINNLELYYGYELPSRARRLLNNNDVIISSVEGSLDKSSLIYNNNNNLLCSTGFLVFNENEFINPETLFCFFRLTLIKELLKKISKGTILTAFDSNSICDIEIPNLDKNVQNSIAEKVQESYKARDRAKDLLEEAKKKVEDAIENGER